MSVVACLCGKCLFFSAAQKRSNSMVSDTNGRHRSVGVGLFCNGILFLLQQRDLKLWKRIFAGTNCQRGKIFSTIPEGSSCRGRDVVVCGIRGFVMQWAHSARYSLAMLMNIMWGVQPFTSVLLECWRRCSGGVITGGYRGQSESAADRMRCMGIASEGAWPSRQCGEDERCLAAEAADLASASAFGCLVGVGSRKCTIATEHISSCLCACGGCGKVDAGLAFTGNY